MVQITAKATVRFLLYTVEQNAVSDWNKVQVLPCMCASFHFSPKESLLLQAMCLLSLTSVMLRVHYVSCN